MAVTTPRTCIDLGRLATSRCLPRGAPDGRDHDQPRRQAGAQHRYGVGTSSRRPASSCTFYGSVLGELLFNWRIKLKYRSVLLQPRLATSPSAPARWSSAAGWCSSSSRCRSSPAPRSACRATRASSRSAPRRSPASSAASPTPARSRRSIAGVALAAQVGAGFTAELGAMRISDEIDALEVMSVPSKPYLVATRVDRRRRRHHPALPDLAVRQLLRHPARDHAGSSGSPRASTTTTSASTCRPSTSSSASSRPCIFAIVVALIHCYYGYNATGGPAGVGVAVGRAIRLSIVLGRRPQLRAVAPLLGRREHRVAVGVTA